ncbi:MAG: methyltransferase [Clostridium sp.]
MIKETWKQIAENHDIRQNLSKLRQELKERGGLEALLHDCTGIEEVLFPLLKSEDAKTRKNTALLLGDIGKQAYLEPIYGAYESEQQMFVKSSYLTAISNFDYRDYVPEFKSRLEQLSNVEMTPENQKHITEEIRELSSLIIEIEGVKMHRFRGEDETYDIVLLTNRNFPEITIKELRELEPGAKVKAFGAGVIGSVENLNWLDEIRTYQELLFTVKGMQTCPMDAEKAAEIIVNSQLLTFMNKGHEGTPPYYFRIEFKSKMELDKKSAFTKKLSSQIEKRSNRTLINTTSNYEFEIRLIENKEGECNILVKLCTLKDERFSYRKEVTPTSIKAVNAALTVALAKEYMKEEAQVLDPFCGVGTMLIERHKAVKANTMYGIDLQEDAILKARKNTEAARQIIHYINRDFFDFKHEYLFDEIITNMPFKIGRTTEDEIYELYVRFFGKAKEFLNKDGMMILYSHDEEYVRQMAPVNGFRIIKTYEISLKEGTYVFVLSGQSSGRQIIK